MKVAARNPAGVTPANANEVTDSQVIDGTASEVVAGKIGPSETKVNGDANQTTGQVATGTGVDDQNALATDASGEANIAVTRDNNSQELDLASTNRRPDDGSATVAITEEDQLFWARIELLSELAEADRQRVLDEQRLAEAKARKGLIEQELSELNAKIPTLSTVVMDSRDTVIDAASRIATLVRERRIPERKLDDSKQTPKIEDKSAAGDKASASDLHPDAWRAIPTSVVLDGIVGLGKKKRDSVIEIAPTLGKLEDLRAQASKEHKRFHEVLPKGIGESVGDDIDNAMCNHYAEWARQHATSAPTSRALAERLYAEVHQLSLNAGWRPSDCELGEGDNEQHHAGFAAYLNKLPITDLPYSNEEHAKSWIIGWRCAEVCGEAEVKSESKSKSESKAKPEDQATPKKRGRKKKNESGALSPDEAAAAAAAM